ncbi:MAG: helix-turn-helix domain-containing protein [Ottowia sp.]|uniref:IclR family transcriptional regulator n=1 Tax=Ottowia sp. TaxID=1898956 RepID=UPI003C728B5A
MADYHVKSAQRVLELLEFFAETRRPALVKEVSQALGYPQSSTSVLLKSLVESGYFDYESRSGMYVPNVRLALATAWIEEQLFTEQGLLRLMQGILDACGHTVMIGTQQGVHVRYLHVLQATRQGRFIAKTGSLRPLFRSAPGRMLLTAHPEKNIGLLLRKANALENDERLHVELKAALSDRRKAIRNGYAMSLGTSTPGASALAILLPVPRGHEPLTLSLGGPINEIESDRKTLVDLLYSATEPFRKAADRPAARMGE